MTSNLATSARGGALRPRSARGLAAVAALVLTALLSPCAEAQRQLSEPEASTGSSPKALATATRHMISAANPYASEAGLEMLRAGGSAVDAAIAAELVLGLVEPQSSGLGGGAFVVHWDRSDKKLETYDGRETAPAAARPDRFLRDGTPMPFGAAVNSGLSIGVPGLVRLLEAVHNKHGVLPWARLFEPAIRLAGEGFTVSQRLYFLLRWFGPESFDPAARRYFFDVSGSAWPIGYTLRNPEYAATLKAIASGGASAFYEGPIADAIVVAARGAPNVPGDLARGDLAGYGVKERPPLCFTYRARKICSMGPPSSGGLTIGQTLELLEPLDLGRGRDAAMSPGAMHLIAEAEKLAFADRDRFIADPEFVAVPEGLLERAYLDKRRTLIAPERTMERPAAGEPPGLAKRALGADATLESSGTSHISVIDGDGNAVAMTATIEGVFGSGVWARGFLLNNELTDFSFLPADQQGRAIANRVEAGKRPRSSMAPTIVFGDKGEVEAVLGSPGGPRIILFVVKALIALVDWDLDAQAAAALLNFGSMGGAVEIEYDRSAVWYALKLKTLGHEVAPHIMNSGLHIIVARGGRLEGGADPRREGVALGD